MCWQGVLVEQAAWQGGQLVTQHQAQAGLCGLEAAAEEVAVGVDTAGAVVVDEAAVATGVVVVVPAARDIAHTDQNHGLRLFTMVIAKAVVAVLAAHDIAHTDYAHGSRLFTLVVVKLGWQQGRWCYCRQLAILPILILPSWLAPPRIVLLRLQCWRPAISPLP